MLAEGENGVSLLLPGGDVLALRASDVASVVRAPDAPAKGVHLRYRAPTAKQPGGLELAVTTWVGPSGKPRVDLVGAVHVGDRAYYRAAQRLLDRADATLYEAVMREGQTARDLEAARGVETPDNPIRELQTSLARWFGLTFQLDEIDYTRPHFVHADMLLAGEGDGSVGAGEAAAGKPQEQIELPVAMRMVMGLVRLARPVLDGLLGNAETAGPMRLNLKRQFAAALGTVDMQKALSGLGPRFAATVLDDRNEIVLARLAETTAAEGVESVAIFYGAAHLPGIEAGLEKMGYRRAAAHWLVAWQVE